MDKICYMFEELGSLLLFKKEYKEQDGTIVIHDLGERFGYWFLSVFTVAFVGICCFGICLILIRFWLHLLIFVTVCTGLGFIFCYIGTLGRKVCKLSTLVNEKENE